MKKIVSYIFFTMAVSSCGGDGNDTSTNIVDDHSCSETKQTDCTDLQNKQLPRNNSTSIRLRKLDTDPIAYGFDYPVGNKGYDTQGNKIQIDERIPIYSNGYNAKRNDEYNLMEGIVSNNSRSGNNPGNNWYNINDVGNFYNGKGGKGVHPGEDWNLGGGDAGQAIYSVADGVVEEISKVGSTVANRGWKIIVRHRLPDNTYIYSIYLHVTSDNNNNGTLTLRETDFSYQEGDIVNKGDIIARVATGMTAVPEHLHFEMRTLFTSGSDLYDNANGNGYYTHNGTTQTSMTKSQIITAFKKMKADEIFDPSDYIDDHREIVPLIGNGSIISYHAEQRSQGFLSQDSEYPYGLKKDVTESQTQHVKQSGYFQWQVSSTCDALKIDYPNQNFNANITVGHWSNRKNDITFKDAQFPFIIGKSNMGVNFNYDGNDWYVVSIGLKPAASTILESSERLTATCVNSSPTVHNGQTTRGDFVLIGEHQWNGNASIISRTFKDYPFEVNQSYADSWPFGVYRDVTRIHKNQYKPVVYFQWMSSDSCKKLAIDVPGLANKGVSIGTKNWNGREYSEYSTSLPTTITATGVWTVIKVAFYAPVDKTYSVHAVCEN